MNISFGELNWLAILVSIVVGQIISTIWFVPLFGEKWAKEYGAGSKQQHAKEVPPYTYAVGLACTAILTLSIAMLQRGLGVHSAADGITIGLLLAIGLCAATMLPGQAFLKRWNVFLIAAGSQTAMILAISLILALWK